MEKPKLYVFAGGNGAGKSTFSYDLTPKDTIIINPDLIAAEFKNSFLANHAIGKMKDDAILSKSSLLIETNFLFEDEIDSFLKFKDAGFDLHLYYFVLSSLKESELRVHARKTKGGHFVDDYTRELNFTIGLDNSVTHAHHFDTVRVIANTIYFQKELLHVEQRIVKHQDYDDMQWTKRVAERFLSSLDQADSSSKSSM